MKIILTEQQLNNIVDNHFIYHGTGKGQALNIQKTGYMKPNNVGEEKPSISFTDKLDYAKYYANAKGGPDKMTILRTRLNNSFILSDRIRKNFGHEYITFNPISSEDLQILTPDGWKYLNHWNVIFNEPLNEVRKDEFADFEKIFQKSSFIEKEKPIGYAINTPVFLNPKNLKNFDENVRAILDKKGNLYVALNDDFINHGHVGNAFGFKNIYHSSEHFLLHRVGKTNTFGLSDSEDWNLVNDDNNPNEEQIQKIKKAFEFAKIKNPQYNFIMKYYEKISIMNEQTINGITAYHGSNSEIDLFKTDFVGGQDAIDAQGPGVYFTDNKEDAEHYGNYLYTVNINPKNILSHQNKKGITPKLIIDLIKLNPDWEMNAYDWHENLQKGLKLSVQAILDNDNAKDIITQVYIEYYMHQPLLYVKNCVKLGIDGISHRNMWGDGINSSLHYIIYNPNIVHIIKKEQNENINN